MPKAARDTAGVPDERAASQQLVSGLPADVTFSYHPHFILPCRAQVRPAI